MDRARKALLDKKGENLTVLDVRGISSVTSYYLLVSGTSAPHIRALADSVERSMRDAKVRVYRRSGTAESEWIALDFIDVVVHIFSDQARRYYDLESLWKDAVTIEDES